MLSMIYYDYLPFFIGVAVDSASTKGIAIIKKTGKVALLEDEIKNSMFIQIKFIYNKT